MPSNKSQVWYLWYCIVSVRPVIAGILQEMPVNLQLFFARTVVGPLLFVLYVDELCDIVAECGR